MFLKWNHNLYSKERNIESLFLFLAGAGFFKEYDNMSDFEQAYTHVLCENVFKTPPNKSGINGQKIQLESGSLIQLMIQLPSLKKESRSEILGVKNE